MDGPEVIRRCRLLAQATETPGEITRTFLSRPMYEVHAQVRAWMREASLEVSVDAVGNIRGVRGEGPRLMIGSHLDTVPNGGAFDGILGVMLGIALAARHPSCALEVVGFSEEEGVRFGVPFIGSRALVGDPVMDLQVLDAIRAFGLDPAAIPQTAIGSEVRGYLEFHIEQGPVLEQMNLPVAVVSAIVGQVRAEVQFSGKAGHAGTTPMSHRQDALAGAAEWIRVVEDAARETPGLVATVGRLEVRPGAANVIPATVRVSLDVRHAYDLALQQALGYLQSSALAIAKRRGLGFSTLSFSQQAPIAMDSAMTGALSAAIESAGYAVHSMPSGAGHDAMILARRVPSAMLFLRSPGGISHHPDEAVLPQDIDAAVAVSSEFLRTWRPT